VAGGVLNLDPHQTYPSCCQMAYTLFCIVPGDKTLFSVKVDETQTVDELKKAIKNENPHKFENVDAYELTLYRVEVDQPHEKQKRNDELKRSFQNLDECTELDEEQQLSKYFGESPPVGKKYYILVVPPQRKSIDP